MQKCNLVTTYQKTMNMSKSCTNLFQPCQNYSIITGSVNAIFNTTNYKIDALLIESKPKIMASQLPCTAKDGCALKGKKILIFYYYFSLLLSSPTFSFSFFLWFLSLSLSLSLFFLSFFISLVHLFANAEAKK